MSFTPFCEILVTINHAIFFPPQQRYLRLFTNTRVGVYTCVQTRARVCQLNISIPSAEFVFTRDRDIRPYMP